MNKHLNEWRPDTCGCVLEFAFDDDEDAETRTHEWESTKKTCPAHIAIIGEALFTAVLEENRRKNVALGMIKTLSTIDQSILQDSHTWSFDDSTPRVLTLSFKRNVPSNELTGIRTATDLQFGPNLVIIER